MNHGTILEWIRLGAALLLFVYSVYNGFIAPTSAFSDWKVLPEDHIWRGNMLNAILRTLGSLLFLYISIVAIHVESEAPPSWAVTTAQLASTCLIFVFLGVSLNIRHMQKKASS